MGTGCTVSWCLMGQTDLGVNGIYKHLKTAIWDQIILSILSLYHAIHCRGFLQISCHHLPSGSSPLNPPLQAVKTHSQAPAPKTHYCQFRAEGSLLNYWHLAWNLATLNRLHHVVSHSSAQSHTEWITVWKLTSCLALFGGSRLFSSALVLQEENSRASWTLETCNVTKKSVCLSCVFAELSTVDVTLNNTF